MATLQENVCGVYSTVTGDAIELSQQSALQGESTETIQETSISHHAQLIIIMHYFTAYRVASSQCLVIKHKRLNYDHASITFVPYQ